MRENRSFLPFNIQLLSVRVLIHIKIKKITKQKRCYKAVRIRSQLHHMIKNCHLRDFWLEKISKPVGASSVCTKSKLYLQQNIDNINFYKLLRLDFLKRALW